MNIKFLKQNQKKKIFSQLNQQYGIKNYSGELLISGKNKLRLFTGNLKQQIIFNLREITPIEGIGLYIGKIQDSIGNIRLTIDGSLLFKEQISKNILKLNKPDIEKWMLGSDIIKSFPEKGWFIISHGKNKDFFGSGKVSENKLGNFIPKERRLKHKN